MKIETRATTVAEMVPELRAWAHSLRSSQKLADELVEDTLELAINDLDQVAPKADTRRWLYSLMVDIHSGRRKSRAAAARKLMRG
ncbi:hypothetical protein E5S70_35190 [Ensifer adhaerens]|uniref:hypothetical protein n=1 Tax=Ensifer canadensis TaxID=555315 RepID=UPI00148F5440|nr:hypothetical protein [Ensifer canadensis]NOV21188.1 hypothetical protein [Ensifer canadensis]